VGGSVRRPAPPRCDLGWHPPVERTAVPAPSRSSASRVHGRRTGDPSAPGVGSPVQCVRAPPAPSPVARRSSTVWAGAGWERTCASLTPFHGLPPALLTGGSGTAGLRDQSWAPLPPVRGPLAPVPGLRRPGGGGADTRPWLHGGDLSSA